MLRFAKSELKLLILVNCLGSIWANTICEHGISAFKKYNETYHSKSENVTWSGNLELKISKDSTGNKIDTDVEIGQKLYLFMTAPANYKISPKSCVAKPTVGDDKDSVAMWTVTQNNTCNQYDQALIDKTWNVTNGKLSIIMYGFRFVKSKSVTVTCNALVCPVSATSLCKQFCVNTPAAHGQGRRRRSAIEKSTYSQKSASISFRVKTRVKANGTTGLILNADVYPFLLFLWMIGMNRHAFIVIDTNIQYV
ncbi:unnamed protein product [Mytilus edulis]|uniref:ZP domain-containing protein n=1 Tax=Mytilus edulis TaxID=6550 RepID=A0A8S3SMC3_MYTED|nr:unnamed protein product [Mytilus edulis]